MINCGYHFTHENGITIDRPTGTVFYVFVLHKTSAELLVNDKMITVDKNSFILYEPSTRQYYRELEKPFINDWIHFTGEGVSDFFSKIDFPLNRPIKIPDFHTISHCILQLQNAKRQSGIFSENIIDLDLTSMFYKLCNSTNASENSNRYLQQFTELRNELYGAPKVHYSVEQLAAKVHLSKSYFQHVYKEIFGCSVIDDMITGRLQNAEYLLTNSSFLISEIAELCGYQNDVHFMRQFKKSTGVTPSQYRAQMISPVLPGSSADAGVLPGGTV